MPIKDLARSKEELVTATIDTAVTALAESLEEHNVGSVVITDPPKPPGALEGRTISTRPSINVGAQGPRGIVTDRDLALRVLASNFSINELTAKDVMTEDPITADADADAFEVVKLMHENKVRRMPIIDEEELTGIITLDDIIVLLNGEIQKMDTGGKAVSELSDKHLRAIIESQLPNVVQISDDIAGLIKAESPPRQMH